MRACVLHAIGDLRAGEVSDPVPGPGQVRVRVAACGICGSDLPRVFEKGTYRFPLIPGHEMAGVVEKVGAGVARVAPGDRVAVFPLLPCGWCEPCRLGWLHLCDDYGYLGSRCDGGFAELVLAPEANLVPVPEGVSLEHAALTEPAAVARHALRRGGLAKGETVWIVGAGTIGLVLAQWAHELGASQVFVSDVQKFKLDLARRWPGVLVCDAREHDAPGWVRDETHGRGADLVVEAVGMAVTAAQAIRGARKRGRVVLMGNPAGEMVLPQNDYALILRHELDVVGTWNSDRGAGGEGDWAESLRAMCEGALDLDPIVTHRTPLEGVPSLMERMRRGEEPYVKAIVAP
ncbi:MAG TPA: galactitol-1-phosphate 5-dehydrogenase [Armatimonadota bacterium]|nr:galactitol-1-phosphate 5-dehydrogenase [Armatimonadota bacterium]